MSVFIVSMTWSNENVVTLYIKEVPVMNDEFDFWGVGTNDRIKTMLILIGNWCKYDTIYWPKSVLEYYYYFKIATFEFYEVWGQETRSNIMLSYDMCSLK